MKWYWKVRLYSPTGNYNTACAKTQPTLCEIAVVQSVYETLTGCKMVIEGMSEEPYDAPTLKDAFAATWTPIHG